MSQLRYADAPRAREIAAATRLFVESEVIPHEAAQHFEGLSPEALRDLREKARARGLYGPQIPTHLGGLGLSLRDCVPVYEEAGRSLLGPLALNCAAPDEGNMRLLGLVATPLQQERYLRPLAEGRIRSAFAMSEPAPGAGSDPSLLRTKGRLEGNEWVLDGQKWFVTGADGAAFILVMAVTDPAVAPTRGSTMFIVDSDRAGLTVKQRLPVGGAEPPGGHGELLLEGVRVPRSAVLGREGDGFRLAQQRLEPVRLAHCMRWIGTADRALAIAVAKMKERRAFGTLLADKQALQWMIADSLLELHAARLLVRHAADAFGRDGDARMEVALTKVHVSESVHRIIDRAIQICGAIGLTELLPLSAFYAEARAFRIHDGPSEVLRMVAARHFLRSGR